jgi:uridine phosphorylase
MLLNKDAAVIEPKKGRREKHLPALCILVFSPQDLELILSALSVPNRRSHKLFLADVYPGTHSGIDFCVAGPSLGAPQTVLVLEKLIALGVTHILALGWCGSLQPQVVIGDIVLPTGAVAEEGTSGHYPISVPHPGPAPELLSCCKQVLAKYSVSIHEGPVWTMDAPYRETIGKILQYQGEGILGVEMEVSALFTVACFRHIRLTAVLVVSDELHSLSWVHGFNQTRFQQTRQLLAESLVQIIGGMAKTLELTQTRARRGNLPAAVEE